MSDDALNFPCLQVQPIPAALPQARHCPETSIDSTVRVCPVHQSCNYAGGKILSMLLIALSAGAAPGAALSGDVDRFYCTRLSDTSKL